jgi:hypothetical protein
MCCECGGAWHFPFYRGKRSLRLSSISFADVELGKKGVLVGSSPISGLSCCFVAVLLLLAVICSLCCIGLWEIPGPFEIGIVRLYTT